MFHPPSGYSSMKILNYGGQIMGAYVAYRLPFSVNACERYDMGKSVFLAFCPKIYTPDTGAEL